MRGHIKKRGKNSWSVVVTLARDANGRYPRKWHTVRGTKKMAQQELTRILKDLDDGAYVSPTKVTVEDHLDKWLSAIEPNVARKTYVRYEEVCKRHLIPALGHLKLRKLTAEHIDIYYASALREGRLDGSGGLAPRTVLHHHRILSEALERAVKWKVLAQNPAKAAEPPRVRKGNIKALDPDALAKLLSAAEGTALYGPILISLTTGLRRGELVGIKWDDIDLDGATLSVCRSIEQVRGKIGIKPPKTEKSKRKITLPEIAVAELKQHRLKQKKDKLRLGLIYADEGWVFSSEDGSLWKPDTLTSAFRRLAQDAEIGDHTFHHLRHTHATQLLSDGIFIKVVSERLGHSSVQITLDTYAHVMPGMQDEAAASINAVIVNSLARLPKNC